MEAVSAAVPPQLPARLLRFFAKYPPQLYGAKFTGQRIPLTKKEAKLLRIAEAEEKGQRKLLAESRAEERRPKGAAPRTPTESNTTNATNTELTKAPIAIPAIPTPSGLNPQYSPLPRLDTATKTQVQIPPLSSSEWDRIRAINAGQIKAPKAKPVIPMPSVMTPKYISLPRLERLRIQSYQPSPVRTEPHSTQVPMPAILESDVSAELASQSPPKPTRKFPPNPFLPRRHGRKWQGAVVSLRRQAELHKIANQYGVEALLPASRKSTEFKQERLLKHGLRVRGTGEGQKVKGHKWERNYGAKMEERYKAIQNMPALIRDWEARGHGRGLKREQYPRVKMP